MKKWIVSICIIFLVFFICTYFIIPSSIVINNNTYCKGNLNVAYRYIVSENAWKKWWDSSQTESVKKFEYNGYNYKLANTYINGILISVNKGSDNFKTELSISELPNDSLFISCKSNINSGLNPFKRIKDYFSLNNFKTSNSVVISRFKSFIENNKKVYGLAINQSSIEHIFLITNKITFDHTPSTKEDYERIDYLKQFAAMHNLRQVYFPMLNVIKNNDTSYRLMVALPVDKETDFTGNISSVRMVQGNFLITEVKGGYKTIDNALTQVNTYMEDYNRISMAIPFQYLITDRLSVPDTSKWVTKIYFPVE